MAIRGKRAYYQKAEISTPGRTLNDKLEALLRRAFQTLPTSDDQVITLLDQSQFHVNKLEVANGYVFFHIVQLKPGFERSGYRKTSNTPQRVISIPAGMDAEFVLHDLCVLISNNDVIVFGGAFHDRSLTLFINALLKKCQVLASIGEVVVITNVLKRGAVADLERYGVGSINLDAVQNSEVIGIAAHQRQGLLGKLLNSDIAKENKIKVHLQIDANGRFKKNNEDIQAKMIEEAKALIAGAADDDWDGIKITLGNGTVLNRGHYLEGEDITIARIGETLSPSDAEGKMAQYWARLNSSANTVRDQ